jgi:S-adenosylmethionine/arginine decarboxylase-like enzyme
MIVDGEKCYGKELILDLHDCVVGRFNRDSIKAYFVQLCELIDMKREDLHFWDDEGVPENERRTEPHVVGITAVQFILTSNVTIHALDLLKKVFVNIFSCKEFDVDKATQFTQRWFGGHIENCHVIKRR